MGTVAEKKVNYVELVSEARVAQVIREEEELASKDAQVQAIKAQTKHLILKMQEAAEADDAELRRTYRNEIVELNLRLVTAVLAKYGAFNQDKFQNGSIGLLKAAETYNPAKEVPFHNYAAFCIETEVRQAFRRVNRAFESKHKGFLDSLDATTNPDNGDKASELYDSIYDPFAEQEFDDIIADAEIDTLFYEIIIPSIDLYGTRSNDIDLEQWKKLEIQYFIELSMENSQRQRLTFTSMAKQLGSTPQNLRIRHKKLMKRIKEKCAEYGYRISEVRPGKKRIVREDMTCAVNKKKDGKKSRVKGMLK